MTKPRQPIFVLGLQRSGTTWAANLLAAHPQIAAIEASRHHGVHESVFFSHFARAFGEWSDPTSKEQALAALLKSDYVALSGLHEADLHRIAQSTDGAGAFFAAFMDAVANARGTLAWVEKSPHHTLLGDVMAAALPEAKFLCITRDSRTLVRSRLWSYGRTPPPYPKRAWVILRACASNAYHTRYLKGFAKRLGPTRAQLITFEDLQRNQSEAIDPLLQTCGLAPMGDVKSAYARNSSFGTEGKRKDALGRLDTFLVDLCQLAVTCVPLRLLTTIQRRIAARRPIAFPDWVWAQPHPTSNNLSSGG